MKISLKLHLKTIFINSHIDLQHEQELSQWLCMYNLFTPGHCPAHLHSQGTSM